MKSAAVLLVLAVPLSGCFAELLSEGPLTTLRFACAAMDRTGGLGLVAHLEEGVEVPEEPLRRLAAQLEDVARRPAGSVETRVLAGPERPEGGWEAVSLAQWAEGQEVQVRGGVRLHVLWTSALPEETPAGTNVLPAVVALSLSEAEAGARLTGRPLEDVATAMLLHHAGHALGLVNDGIPVQDPELQKREYPPRHDPDPGSVMHANWHQAATMAWTEQALRFPDGAVQDLRGAAAPGGVCP